MAVLPLTCATWQLLELRSRSHVRNGLGNGLEGASLKWIDHQTDYSDSWITARNDLWRRCPIVTSTIGVGASLVHDTAQQLIWLENEKKLQARREWYGGRE